MNVIGLPEGWKMAREIDLLHDRQTFLRVNKLCAGLTVGVLALGLVIYLLWPWAFPLAGWGAQAVGGPAGHAGLYAAARGGAWGVHLGLCPAQAAFWLWRRLHLDRAEGRLL